MELKDRLLNIFHNDYPGVDTFIQEVAIPVLGDDIDYVNRDFIDDEQYHARAQRAGITRLLYVADITEQNYNSNQIALFDVTLDARVNIERARVNIQSVIRSIVMHHSHILILFHYENPERQPWRFSYAYKPSSIADTTTARRYTYVFGRDYSGRTAAERFCVLASSDRSDADFVKAFSVEALSDEFFDRYRNLYADFVQFITDCRYVKHGSKWEEEDYGNPNPQFLSTFGGDKKLVRDYVKKMFGRIVFLYFLQRKGWLAKNLNYMHDLYANSEHKDCFLDDVLEPLFFEVLNTDKPYRTDTAKALPGSEDIPYLNGGLFAQDEIDDLPCVFPSRLFDALFDFLDGYNFTINENDSEDAEIGIDPEMLGRIFENLLEDNKDKGAFYTPKEIVDYMCRESIIAYLQDERFTEEGNKLIRKFVETMDRAGLSDIQRGHLRDKLKAVKICDPAIGSGAFPMGLVNLLSKLYMALGVNAEAMPRIKRHIMENNIYGVDIEAGAVDIARLRFWLAMIVDEKEPQPLPNLHFKIMQGNSLVESYEGRDLSNLTNTGGAEPGTLDFDSFEKQMLQSTLHTYYNTSDHRQRDRIFNDVRNNILCQVYNNYNITFPEGFDPSANDKFFLWHTWFSDVFENGGFDIVIGNPPYIKEYTNRDAFNGFREMSPYYRGKMDLWYGFACQAIDHLNPNGVLCFIATNNWVTNTGASILRNKILDDGRMLQLIDFNDYMIFEDSASIQTMILLLKRQNVDEYTFEYRKLSKSGPKKEDAIKLLSTKEPTVGFAMVLNPTIRTSVLYNNTFNFSPSDKDEILDKMMSGSAYLYEEDLAQGIVPNPDVVNARNIKSFSEEDIKKREISKGDGVFVVDYHKFDNLSDCEKKYLKDLYEPIDIDRYNISIPSKKIIYISKGDYMGDAPSLEKHLFLYHEIMDKRRENVNGRLEFKHLHWPRERYWFDEGPKILAVRKCDKYPIFLYTETVAYVMMAINVIRTNRFNLRFLSGLFNSKLIEFWLRNRGKMQGNNFQIDKEPLLKIPIKANAESVKAIAALVDDILTLKGYNQSANISTQEVEIDKLVYHLYGLTYDEVLIVDPDTPITLEEYENNVN